MCGTVQALRDRVQRAVRHRRRRRAFADPRGTGMERRADAGGFWPRRWRGHLAVPGLGGAAPHRPAGVLYRYVNEVPKFSDEAGVAEADKLAAAAQEGH